MMKQLTAQSRIPVLLGFASLLLAAVALGTVAPAAAQSGGPYDLSWNTIDGGGYAFSTGGDYALRGTIGQPDAGLMLGGSYSLTGGFWSSGAVPFRIYLPLVLRGF